MKNYIGNCPINKALSKKLNYGSWLIYRDPAIGLYAYNQETGEDVGLYIWNMTSKNFNDVLRQHIINFLENRD